MKTIFITCVAFVMSCSLYGAGFIVKEGEVNSTTQVMDTAGDQGLVEEGGTILVDSGDGVDMQAANQTTLNKGVIATTGDDNEGILSAGDHNIITNNGQISTEGDGSEGIFNDGGNNAIITNNGLISTKGTSDSEGIFNSSGNNAIITNNGLISTEASFAPGIVNDGGNNAIITNNGLISTKDTVSYGIENSGGDNNIITNNGLISTKGDGAEGIECSGDNNIITNSGLLSVAGIDARGIDSASGSNNHVINSGTIRSLQSDAIRMEGTNPNLTLLRGSNLQGPVNIVNDSLYLTVETGLNLALTLTDGNDGFANLEIEAPFVQVGNTIAVIDPTGLGLQADMLTDLSDAIFSEVFRYDRAFGCNCSPCDSHLWVQGIGSFRERGHNSGNVGHNNWQGGVLVGIDRAACGGTLGLFVGYAYAKAEVDERTQQAETDSYLAGLSYEYTFCDTFFGFAIAAGYVDWTNERFIMDNSKELGIQKVSFEKGASFVTPEAVVAHQFHCLNSLPVLSFTLRYAGLFLGDYEENRHPFPFTDGATGALKVKDRNVGVVNTRLELAIPWGKTCGCFCWSVRPYLGILGRYQVEGTHVESELLGESLGFEQGGPTNLGSFFFGFRAAQSIGSCSLFLNLEASFDDANSARILGAGGLSFAF